MTYTPRTQLFEDLTSDEIAEAARNNAMVLVPVGAIEQHARHMAVKTDIYLSSNVAKLAAARVGSVPVLVAPGLPFGFSPHHVSHAGTISLRLATFLGVLRDVATSLVNSGFKRVVFVNGHGGNNAPLRSLVGELVTDGLPVAALDYWVPGESKWIPQLKGALRRGGHACEQETAVVLALESEENAAWMEKSIVGLPARVIQPWIANDWPEDPVTQYGAAWPPIFQADDCGYYCDPGVATKETGEVLLETIVSELAAFLDQFATTPLRLGVSRDPSKPGISAPIAVNRP
jgi:creatinine amidohydrolase